MSSGSFGKQVKNIAIPPNIVLHNARKSCLEKENKMIDPSEVNNVFQKAENECYNTTSSQVLGQKFCKLIFDGIMCWQDTPAGVLAKQSCSTTYVNPIKNGFAFKQCNDNGEWYSLPNATKSWTDYNQCVDFYIRRDFPEDHTIYKKWIPIIKSITQSGFILSIISLIIALFIFIHIKRLHCARNRLHIHLFASFIIRASMSLIKDGLFVQGTALPHETTYINGQPTFTKTHYSWICKALISIWNYSIMSNYMFLLMEGAYLHNLLFFKFFSENRVAIYYCFGWTFPMLFIIPWIILRIEKEDTYCWTTQTNKYISLLISVPIGITVIMNFVLFTIIMRILFVKLTSMYVQQRWTKYQKLVRAILILVPLFGIPYAVSFVLSFYVAQNQTLEILWLFFDQSFSAFQGLFASLVYCLLNGEVQVEIARKYRTFQDRSKNLKRRSRTISHTTQIPLTEEMQDFPQNFGAKDQLVDKKTSDYF